MKKLVIIFPGYTMTDIVCSIIKDWNKKSGDRVDAEKSPHERLSGKFTCGAVMIKNQLDGSDDYHEGVIFETSYSEGSYARIGDDKIGLIPTGKALMKWLLDIPKPAVLVFEE